MTSPSIGDIWEWDAKKKNHITGERSIILILTKPRLRKTPPIRYEFTALELDSSKSGVIDQWYMYESHSDLWRQLA